MAFETILFEVAGGVARLTLNRPDRLNSFTLQMHQEVAQALSQVEADDGARVLLITGAGRGFCAGQDLLDRAVAPGGEGIDLGRSLDESYNPLVRRLVALPKPVVCAVNGVAAGAGANIAFAADIVLAAKSAKFIQSFANIGLVPDSGGTWILPRLAEGPTKGLAAIKQAIRAAWDNDFDTHLDLERDMQRELGRSADFLEGVSAFAEKRPPKFTGR
jgi:2-(1,2-epoxy-1,2-dihydrophenyl)acetyl-CoA isomerase